MWGCCILLIISASRCTCSVCTPCLSAFLTSTDLTATDRPQYAYTWKSCQTNLRRAKHRHRHPPHPRVLSHLRGPWCNGLLRPGRPISCILKSWYDHNVVTIHLDNNQPWFNNIIITNIVVIRLIYTCTCHTCENIIIIPSHLMQKQPHIHCAHTHTCACTHTHRYAHIHACTCTCISPLTFALSHDSKAPSTRQPQPTGLCSAIQLVPCQPIYVYKYI